MITTGRRPARYAPAATPRAASSRVSPKYVPRRSSSAMTLPTSEHGTPVKKSKPACWSASTKRSAEHGVLTAAAPFRRGRGSPPQLRPGAAIVVEAVDLHPALVDVDGGHDPAAVDHRLEEMGHARLV